MLKATKRIQAPLIDAGLHEAVCYAVIEIGTEHSDAFDKDQRKIILLWEIPDSRIEVDGKSMPRVLNKRYTQSLEMKATLRHDLVSWRTREFTPEEEESFDYATPAGASCMLNVIHKQKQDKTFYSAVGTVLPLKGKKLIPINPVVIYGIEEHGTAIPATVPEWIVKLIKASPEYQVVINPSAMPQPEEEAHAYDDAVPYDDESIPF